MCSNGKLEDLDYSDHHVLFVDDDAGVTIALQHLMIEEDWESSFASGGEEALELMEETEFSMVISDYRMPGMNGVELLRAVHQRHPKTVRVILSGYAEAYVVVESINEGHVDRFLAKPWEEQELLTTIHEGLNKYHLEEVLAKRNAELKFANEVLHNLPFALLGVDAHGQLMVTNEPACALGLGDSLPTELAAPVAQVLESAEPRSVKLERTDGALHAECLPMGQAPASGVIIVIKSC